MESDLHELLKETVLDELGREGYETYVEPSDPPLERLMWSYYRPDILGVICEETVLNVVLVECETNPNVRRVKTKASKIGCTFTVQKRLNENNLLRLLLVIPAGVLHKVNHQVIRSLWEIWLVSNKGKVVYRIPKSDREQAKAH